MKRSSGGGLNHAIGFASSGVVDTRMYASTGNLRRKVRLEISASCARKPFSASGLVLSTHFFAHMGLGRAVQGGPRPLDIKI